MQVSEKALKQLKTKRATVTPCWWALLIMFKYRSRQNFKQADYLGKPSWPPTLPASQT